MDVHWYLFVAGRKEGNIDGQSGRTVFSAGGACICCMHWECLELVDINVDGYNASLPRHDRQSFCHSIVLELKAAVSSDGKGVLGIGLYTIDFARGYSSCWFLVEKAGMRSQNVCHITNGGTSSVLSNAKCPYGLLLKRFRMTGLAVRKSFG